MIHEVTQENVEEVQVLFEEMTGEVIPKKEARKRVEYAQEDDKLDLYLYWKDNYSAVGMVGLKVNDIEEIGQRWGEVTVLVVKEELRGKGLGKELIDFAEEKAQEKECEGMYLVSGFGKQTPAYNLYLQQGYADLGNKLAKRL